MSSLPVLTGLVALVSAVVGGYSVLTYFLVGHQPGMTWADPAGTAIAFLPAWAFAVTRLLGTLRG